MKKHISFTNTSFACIALIIAMLNYAVSEGAALDQRLFSIDQETRETALRELSMLDIDSKRELIPALIEALKSDYRYLRLGAIEAMAKIGSPAVPALVETLEGEDLSFRKRAVLEALEKIGPEAKEAVPALIQALSYNDDAVRHLAVIAIGEIGLAAKDAIPALIKFMRNNIDNSYYTNYTLRALGKIGTASIPILVEALKDQNRNVRWYAANAFEKIGTAAVPILIELLKDERAYVRASSALALGNIGPEAKEAIPALIEALRDQDESVRSYAAVALGDIGPTAKDAVPLLVNSLKNMNENARFNTAKLILNIDPTVDEAISELIKALKSENSFLKVNAAITLGNLGTKSWKAVPALVRLLQAQHEDYNDRLQAAEALKKIGSAAKEAVPDLIQILNDENSAFRGAAAKVLLEIGTPDTIKALNHYWKKEFLQAEHLERERQRLYTKGEVLINKPPDRELIYSVPVKVWNQKEMLVTVHRRRNYPDPDILVIWLKVKNKFKTLKVMESGLGQYFIRPATSFKYRGEIFLHIILDLGGTGGSKKDTIFCILPDNTLQEITFEPAGVWYADSDKLNQREYAEVEHNSFLDDKLEFILYIANYGDSTCCPSAGKVVGSYKITGERRYDQVKKRYIADYKMIVDSYRREPIKDKNR